MHPDTLWDPSNEVLKELKWFFAPFQRKLANSIFILTERPVNNGELAQYPWPLPSYFPKFLNKMVIKDGSNKTSDANMLNRTEKGIFQ